MIINLCIHFPKYIFFLICKLLILLIYICLIFVTAIKTKFSSKPILDYLDRNLPFLVETESSNFAIGAILSPDYNKTYPVAFYSKSLTLDERNYPIYYKELLAVVDSSEHWSVTNGGVRQLKFSIKILFTRKLINKKTE